MITIYVLLDDNQIRYIGKTTATNLKEKLEQHLLDAIANPDKFEWINKLFEVGKRPEIKSILTYEDHEADYYEKLFLNHYKFFVGLKLSEIEHPGSQKLFELIEEKQKSASFKMSMPLSS